MISFDRERIPEGNWPFVKISEDVINLLECEYIIHDINLKDKEGNIRRDKCIESYIQIHIRRLLDTSKSMIISWNNGNCMGAIVCGRSLIESISVFHSFLSNLDYLVNKKEWDLIGELITEYSFSTMRGPRKKLESEFKPPRIKKAVTNFIKSTHPDSDQFWEQLCDIAHPNGEPMMNYYGRLKEGKFYHSNPEETEPYLFVPIYNCFYSICWFINALDECEILLEQLRQGGPLPENHPLLERRRVLDDIEQSVLKEMPKLKVGPKGG